MSLLVVYQKPTRSAIGYVCAQGLLGMRAAVAFTERGCFEYFVVESDKVFGCWVGGDRFQVAVAMQNERALVY